MTQQTMNKIQWDENKDILGGDMVVSGGVLNLPLPLTTIELNGQWAHSVVSANNVTL